MDHVFYLWPFRLISSLSLLPPLSLSISLSRSLDSSEFVWAVSCVLRFSSASASLFLLFSLALHVDIKIYSDILLASRRFCMFLLIFFFIAVYSCFYLCSGSISFPVTSRIYRECAIFYSISTNYYYWQSKQKEEQHSIRMCTIKGMEQDPSHCQMA